ncbi:GNAT family N-acetyltransferase [Roseomonas marmotae]|uniref:GNAT family N-acetyltransferase n=2 Tax=Roseomonas marmotae TaxID=2768161 RepID=A0ABS3KDW1_9PROT|nr:GNAT family N-acetyltransferase [Roseomonas marmotae]MBO1074838.1 GNAT family N-acetyltransferase [Roseomonas marmotae]QTI80884.1 GNAT family N-acetyltransferase [Roseomonas marmotae]
MERPPAGPAPALPADAHVEVVAGCTVPFYRYLYNTVGQDYVWWLRRTVGDAEIANVLADPAVSIHVLYHGGAPAGFYELERRGSGQTNIAYFGLLPHAVGRGMGAGFLRHAIDQGWARGTRLLTVNTCTADHPRALPNYRAAGFTETRRVREIWPVPVRLGLKVPERLLAG